MRLVVVALLAVGCTSAGPAPSEAERLCRAAYPDAEVTAAYDTTVEDVRARRAGPGQTPAAGAWPGTAGTTRAAWCWVTENDDKWVAAAVEGEEPFVFVRGNLPPTSGGPQVP
ncbi:MAG TPA: hypothetical protein VNQ77_19710 [Frankiaceae bacterium]|nr:hypothetical protein [Frankiaceae bacterium]